jgi:hypothetical protein
MVARRDCAEDDAVVELARHARHKGAVVALTLALGAVITGQPSPTAAAPKSVAGDALRINDVVAVGVPSGAGCAFPGQFHVTRTAPADGETRWLEFTIDAQCRVRVSAKWNSAVSDKRVMDRLEAVMGPDAKRVVAQPLSVADSTSAGTSDGSGIRPQIRCKFNRQHIFMFGFGGSGDKLTNLQTEMEFCYDFTNAIVNAHKGSCWGASLPTWRWKVDGCWITFKTQGSAPNVRVSHRGDYHCDPTNVAPCHASNPDGYHHRLFSSIHGSANGAALCNWGWDGIIVFQVQRTVLFGCS